ncbi:unnamed protein product, partial [Hapterophycus canaliculatus]
RILLLFLFASLGFFSSFVFSSRIRACVWGRGLACWLPTFVLRGHVGARSVACGLFPLLLRTSGLLVFPGLYLFFCCRSYRTTRLLPRYPLLAVPAARLRH